MELTGFPFRFFLGSSSPTGFWGTAPRLYDPEDGWRVYLLKGGAGSGKSTLLKRVAARVGEEAELFFCSADPRSLDAVCVPSKRLLVVDATAPHVLEPRLWGACEQLLPLSLCADEGQLYQKRENIAALVRENKEHHRRCRRLLSAAAELLSQNRRTAREALDEEGLRTFAMRLAKQEWDRTACVGKEKTRLLRAVTPDGMITFFETVQALCPRIYVLCDEYGAAAPKLLQQLKQRAVDDGLDVAVSPHPLFPETVTEHLWLPQIGTAFLTANRLHPVDFPVYRRLHMTRFLDTKHVQEHRHQLAFRERAAKELLDGAVTALSEARQVHTALEQYTADATDWEAVLQLTDTFLERMGI